MGFLGFGVYLHRAAKRQERLEVIELLLGFEGLACRVEIFGFRV